MRVSVIGNNPGMAITGQTCRKSPVATSTGSLFFVQVPLQLPSLLLDGLSTGSFSLFLGLAGAGLAVSCDWPLILAPAASAALASSLNTLLSALAVVFAAPFAAPLSIPAPAMAMLPISKARAPPFSASLCISILIASAFTAAMAFCCISATPAGAPPIYSQTFSAATAGAVAATTIPLPNNSPISGTVFQSAFPAPIAASPGLSQAASRLCLLSSTHFLMSPAVS
ncbi:hypothetical protein Xenpb_00975 [Xenorhabdus sp. PB62.4]|nr:hypothetical protein [Xenorhabdus sp. PB62.4]